MTNIRELKEENWKLYFKCKRCWEYKEATKEYFSWNKAWYLWLQSVCRVCVREQQRKYRTENKEKRHAYAKNYYEQHKDIVYERNKKWRENNREKWYNCRRSYIEANKEKYVKHYKEYIRKNRKHINEMERIRDKKEWYRIAHKEAWELIRKLWIRPEKCPICYNNWPIYAHHPDYTKPTEIVFCCQSCHQLIHSWHKECPKPINLLDYEN